MRILDGDTGRCIYFVAVDATDLTTRETGLSSFTVYYSIDGGEDVSLSPTTAECDATNMPGVYALDINAAGMVTVPAGALECEVAVHITKTGMAPVTRVYEVYRGYIRAQAVTGTLSTTQLSTNLTEATNDHYNGCYCLFLSGDNVGQVRKVTDYDGTNKILTVEAMTAAPANNDWFALVNR